MSNLEIAPGKTRIGWIGTGVMGASMAGHLLARGYALTVSSRSRSKAEPLLERGARWAESPSAVVAEADVVFTMLGFPKEVRAVFLGNEGLVASARPGQILVDMSTSEPSLAREIDAACLARGVHAIDAPVSGGDIGAREARLSIMIGGDAAIVEALEPLWSTMGKTFVRQGDAGAGQHTKMVNQILIATGMIGVCEALLYAHRAGLDAERVLSSVGPGAAGSWSLANYGPRILAGNFEPGFYVEHFIKDMGIALDEARRLGLSLPGLALAEQLYLSVQANGWGKKGTHALQLALARISGIDWEARR
ncbi:NAD(P)-dependent oxidoreductase [Pendulispora albinea]|uniref:NAD(P)-dependent oxidoreductase n=1 Tax=Pendulispora albinea TaxID=2741071 RepID=A0ABZ2M6C7_9BACT